MSFLNPIFLLGLAALATPVLVHLVRRTRARRLEFPTLFFVRQIPQRTIRRKKLHNLLLLLLRSLALLLIVLAFTRPFLNSVSGGESLRQKRAVVILLDASFSMRYGNRFAEARQKALDIINEAQDGDRLALVRFDAGYEVLSGLTSDRDKLRAELNGIDVGFGATDYEQALRGAQTLLRESVADGIKRVFLISDFQVSGWKNPNASFRLGEEVALVGIDVGSKEAPNLAITDVSARGVVYGQKYLDNLTTRVANFSDTARDRQAVEFTINDQIVERREVGVNPHETSVVEFTGFNLTEGANRCVVTTKGDEFTPDNNFYFTIRREAPVQALVIETAARGESESLFLRHALMTGENLPFALTVKSAGAVDPTRLGDYGLIVWNDVGGANVALREAIKSYVAGGGHLMIGVGPHTDADEFNQTFAAIAPATLTEDVKLNRLDATAISDVRADHPIFEIFRGGQLSAARFGGYYRSTPMGKSVVLARFEDGAPALIESEGGQKGRVLLFTSTLGKGWTDLPLTSVYLPLVQQMTRHLTERQEAAWHPLGEIFTVPTSLQKNDSALATPAIDAPSGTRLPAQTLGAAGDLLLQGREPGFYRVRYPEQFNFAAVNLDGNESDFAKLNSEEFISAVTGGAAQGVSEAAKAVPNDETLEAGQKIWWPLLLIALLLFVAEALLARKIKMAKMIG